MSKGNHALDVLGKTNVHLDFHVPTFQPGIGTEFDAERFGDRLADANVDSIALFAKGAPGTTFYNTAIGDRHEHLDFDLLERQIKVCDEHDINVLVYYNIGIDNKLGKENYDWVQHDGDGEPILPAGPEWHWYRVCLNAPYYEEIVLPRIKELLEYDIDGFFFDLLSYDDDACKCPYCVRSMEQKGLDPDKLTDRSRHRTEVCKNVTKRTTRLIKDHDEDLTVLYNSSLELGLATDITQHMDIATIESLPSQWGYLHTPMYARYTRNLETPVYGMTGSFHKSWGDFGTVKGESQLKYEVALSLAHHLPISVGDELRPHGKLNEPKYDVIKQTFEFAKERSLPAADPMRDIAVVYPGRHDISGEGLWEYANGAIGSTKHLCETHQQFDILDEELATDLLPEFNVVVLPSTGELRSNTIETIRSFVAEGGSLLATGTSSLTDNGFALGDVFGVEHEGRLPYENAYLGLTEYTANVPETECISYDAFQSISLDGATKKATVIGPTTQPSESRGYIHYQAPPERDLMVPAVTHHEFHDGEVLYIGTGLFTQYFSEDYHAHRTLLDNLLTSLQSPRVLNADAPESVEINAMCNDDRIYVHIVNSQTYRAGESLARTVTDPNPIDIEFDIHAPRANTVIPTTDTSIDVERDGERFIVKVDGVKFHEIVQIE